MDSSFISRPKPRFEGIEIVEFAPGHIDGGVALCAAEGWLHRHKDWDLALTVSRGVAALRAGEVVGTVLRSDFGPTGPHAGLSTISMVLVRGDCRSLGLGRALMAEAIGPGPRALRLVATQEGRALYESMGFAEVSAIDCVHGVVRDVGDSPGVRDAAPADLDAIAALESASFGADRGPLMAAMAGCARLAVLGAPGALRGFAACRPFGPGHVIGPVVAPNPADGLALIAHLARPLLGQRLRVDVTDTSGLQDGLTRMGLRVDYRAPVMERGAPSVGPERLALISQGLV